jgi:DNA-binding response OmpR family regulator
MSRILVVDDEPHLADGLRFNLEAEGHEAVVSYDG